MKNKFPLLSRLLAFVIVPVAAVVVAVVVYFRGALPEPDGTFALSGLAAQVRIERDAQGVPHILAGNDNDVFFSMGYVHAQDRLWQLELQRRFAQGRLSEVFGQASVEQDIWLRTLGLYPSARSAWEALGPAARASLRAYADGINAWRATHKVLPPEFAALGVSPAPWSPIDSLAWVKVFSLNLSGNSSREIARHLVGRSLSAREMASFFGAAAAPAAPPAGGRGDAMMALGAAQQALQQRLGWGANFIGSNAWAVSGRLTGGQGALLANDPHLGLQMPSLWYPVVQSGGALQARGMSLVGLPLVIFGRNAHIAWGGTSMTADVQDLYFEQTNPRDAAQYLAGERWLPYTTRRETIVVRADFPAALRAAPKPIQLQLRSTRHGPVISDAVGLPGQAIALRWTALDAADRTYESFLRLAYAADWPAFQDALSGYVSPALNMLYADREGNIGMLGIGRIPRRAGGDGSLPSPGWNAEHDWRDYIPFEQMPRVYNPPSGYLVSANDKPVDDAYPYFISNDWAPAGRARRIRQLIEQRLARGALTGADAGRMQTDLVSLPAAALLPVLLRNPPRDARQRRALDYLRAWNGEMAAGSPAAAIFNVWMSHLKQRLFGPRLHADWHQRDQAAYFDGLIEATPLERLAPILGGADGAWCGAGAALPRCGDVQADALEEALDELTKLAGRDMDDWAWGKLHFSVYPHAPFSNINLARGWFERRAPSGGSADSINVANQVFVKSEGYHQTFGAGFRQVMTLAPAAGQYLYANSTGQSGNPLSAHYDDMVGMFAHGAYRQLAATAGADRTSSIALVPAGRRGETR